MNYELKSERPKKKRGLTETPLVCTSCAACVYSTLTSICFGLAASDFGISMLSTPLSYFA